MLDHNKMTHAGTAKVVSCNPQLGGRSKRDSHARSSCKFDLILDVYPEGAPAFRAEASEWFSEIRFPDPGDSLRVRCNPEKQAVEIDLSEDARFNPKIFRRADDAKRRQAHDQILNGPPGTPATGGYGEIDDPGLAELVRLQAEEQKHDGEV
jgi:hypothetical protein